MKNNYLGIFIIILLSIINIAEINAILQPISFSNKINYSKYTEMVEMRDGIHLATDFYLPNSISFGPKPVIFISTPYNKNDLEGIVSLFTIRNYVVIIQDMRGRFASEGMDMIFLNASTDDYDTIQWILEQEWCNGKIGTFGPSALGIHQFFMHLASPPNIYAQAIQIASPDFYQDAMFLGGAFREEVVVGWLSGIGSTFWLPYIYSHENYSKVWDNVTLTNKYNLVSSPAVFVSGWFDVFTQGTINGFLGYQNESQASVKGKSFLIIGPWGHGTFADRTQGEITFPENAVSNYYLDFTFNFLDCHLKDQGSLSPYPKVYYYCIGSDEVNAPGNFWRQSSVWPIPVNQTKFYFHDNNFLTQIPPIDEEPESYLYNPNNPVPTIGGGNLNIPFGPRDQSSLETREDVLIFTSDTLNNFLEITGRMSAHLWVSSNCTDTDFTVKITDVYPDGRSILVQDGIVRAKYRDSRTNPEVLTPGEIVEIDVDLWSTSYVFNQGHKIRIAISSSNYPRFSNNPNNGAALFSNNNTYIANNTLYHDSSHPSYISLPINTNGTYPSTTTPTNTTTTTKSSPIYGFYLITFTSSLMVISLSIYEKRRKNRK